MSKPSRLNLAAIIFASLGCLAAWMVYVSRVDITEPGGAWLKSLAVWLWLAPGALALLLSAVASIWEWARERGSRRSALGLAYPVVGALALAAAFTIPVGSTLMSAVYREDVDTVRRSLGWGVSAKTHSTWGFHNAKGESALHVAATKGNVQIVTLLLDHGARVEPDTIFAAAGHGNLKVVKFLLDRGREDRARAYFFSVVVQDVERLEEVAKFGMPLCHAEGPEELTPLMIAAEKGLDRAVQFLIASGCDPSFRNRFGATALSVVEAKILALNEWRERVLAGTKRIHFETSDVPDEDEWKAQMAPYLKVREILHAEGSAD
jgi:hypothetical protein